MAVQSWWANWCRDALDANSGYTYCSADALEELETRTDASFRAFIDKVRPLWMMGKRKMAPKLPQQAVACAETFAAARGPAPPKSVREA